MNYMLWIASVLMIPSVLLAEVSFSKRAEHFAKGTVKVVAAATCTYVMAQAIKAVAEEVKTMRVWPFVSADKREWARKEAFCWGVCVPALAYTAYRLCKSSYFSYQKAFAKEIVTLRSSHQHSDKSFEKVPIGLPASELPASAQAKG